MSDLTNPTWFRTARNNTVAVLLKNRFLAPDTGAGDYRLPAAVTTVGEGVTLEDIPIGGHKSIQVEGIAEVECSAAIAVNAFVESGVDGRAATAAAASAIRGRAKTATTAAGQMVEVELWKGRFIAP